MSDGPSWVQTRERGSVLAFRLARWIVRLLPDLVVRLIAHPICFYIYVTGSEVRRGSQIYREKLYGAPGGREALGGPPTWWQGYWHVYEFGGLMYDRACFWAGKHDKYRVHFHERRHLMKHVDAGRGAILLGAHLGSFDVLRVLADLHDIRVNVLMFTENAERTSEFFRTFDPNAEMRVIQLDPTSVRSAFAVRACLDRGEFVAILGDRHGFDGRGRITYADFLGQPAPFPQGPFLLSLLLRAPTLLLTAVRSGRLEYEVFAEPLGDAEPVSRAARADAVQKQVELFASRLEDYCRRFPLQWANFYDFWAPVGTPSVPPGRAGAPQLATRGGAEEEVGDAG